MKKYDFVVFGATGFTGQLIVEYLSNHKETSQLKWAVAGRSKSKLDSLYNSIDTLVVDSFDIESIDSMCKISKLIITTVGPYSIFGENLIKSCIQYSTHYVDLTGEPDFVNTIQKKYSTKALEKNTIIINCCGLESIIPDLGTYITVNKMSSNEKNITYYLKSKGQISGGTWASFLNAISLNKITKSNKIYNSNNKMKKIFYNKSFNSWALIFPVIDKQIVYRTSKAFDIYNNFSFNEYILIKSLKNVIPLLIGIFFISFLAKFKLIKKWLTYLKPSGTGPNKNLRNNHWFKAIFIGEGENETVKTIISGGDPGYGETSKFISEIALCIINDFSKLKHTKGILTPIECTGDLLIKRLTNAGIKIK
tara:strand:+ start:156 stop:1250 length:1095 start_codon:yes stop_codon:yes gene_type:complete